MLSCERRDVFDRAFETIAGGCRYHGLKTYRGIALPRDSVVADRWYVGSSCQQVGAPHQAEVEGTRIYGKGWRLGCRYRRLGIGARRHLAGAGSVRRWRVLIV